MDMLVVADTGAAKAIFQQLKVEKDPFYSHPAWWYKAMILLKEEDLDGAIRELKGLANAPDLGFQKRAADLLSALE